MFKYAAIFLLSTMSILTMELGELAVNSASQDDQMTQVMNHVRSINERDYAQQIAPLIEIAELYPDDEVAQKTVKSSVGLYLSAKDGNLELFTKYYNKLSQPKIK